MQSKRRRGTLSEYLTNLNAPIPLPKKLWLVARNASIRILRQQTCCGHDGEPGC